MRRVPRLQARNKFDLADRAQVRQMSRRLNVPESELRRIAGRIGTSIAAISKEIALQRTPVPAERRHRCHRCGRSRKRKRFGRYRRLVRRSLRKEKTPDKAGVHVAFG